MVVGLKPGGQLVFIFALEGRGVGLGWGRKKQLGGNRGRKKRGSSTPLAIRREGRGQSARGQGRG